MKTTTPIPNNVIGPVLTATDRCDRCGSQAYVRATMPNGAELLFCNHHNHEHRTALQVVGATFHDETDKLTVGPASAVPV